ncbi:MAG: Crp/Fnr family transcriptional regulator, partial [Myxococcales bacterium]|nr:Crp/Fnr family transcriptional regulator [Myxococcales bacterium]
KGKVIANLPNQTETFGFGPGETVGAVSAFAGREFFYTAVAETDVVMLELSIETVLDIMEDNPELAWRMLGSLAWSFLETRERLVRQQHQQKLDDELAA